MDIKTLEANQTIWKWVFFICCIIFIIPNYSAFPRIDLNFGVILSAINLIGLYGLAYEKPIWSRTFWRVFFWVYITIGAFATIFVALAIGKITNHFDGGLITGPLVLFGNIIVLSLIILFFGVQVLAVYLYSYKREDLWVQNRHGDEKVGKTIHK